MYRNYFSISLSLPSSLSYVLSSLNVSSVILEWSAASCPLLPTRSEFARVLMFGKVSLEIKCVDCPINKFQVILGMIALKIVFHGSTLDFL